MKKPVILIGGGGHCISCIDVIESTNQYKIMGVLDLPEKVGQKVLNYTIIGTDSEIDKFSKQCPNFLITVGQIGSYTLREKIYHQITNAGGCLPTIISPIAHVSKYAIIEEGSIIMHNALVNAGAHIGKVCIINSKALIEHEVQIGDFCHISTSTIINGQTIIGSRCFIGSNSVIANNTSIVDQTIVAAGSQVLKNIELAGTYIGQPIRKIR